MGKILIVEDDAEIAMLERDYLEINGFETEIISDGLEALDALNKNSYSLVILDLMLPGCNGYEICRNIRDTIDIPILMVTARSESIDKIRGFGLGADDYMPKPFDPAELVARVKAHISRYDRIKGSSQKKIAEEMAGDGGSQPDVISLGPIQILPRSWKVYRDNKEIKFPNREFELLLFLARNPNIVFSKDTLFEKIWGYEYMGDSATVTVHINRIREKIEKDPSNPLIIETVWGAGYRLNREDG